VSFVRIFDFPNLLFDFNPLAFESIRLLSNTSCCIESSNCIPSYIGFPIWSLLPYSCSRILVFRLLGFLVFGFVSFVRILRSNLSFESFVSLLTSFFATKPLLTTESLPVGVIFLLLFKIRGCVVPCVRASRLPLCPSRRIPSL